MTHAHPWDAETGWTAVPGEDDGVREWVPMRSANNHLGWFHRHPGQADYSGNHVRVFGGVKIARCRTCEKVVPRGSLRLSGS